MQSESEEMPDTVRSVEEMKQWMRDRRQAQLSGYVETDRTVNAPKRK